MFPINTDFNLTINLDIEDLGGVSIRHLILVGAGLVHILNYQR